VLETLYQRNPKKMSETLLHEDFQRKQEGAGGSDRGFGIVFAIFFTLLSLLPLRAHQPVRWWALAWATISLGVALLQQGLAEWSQHPPSPNLLSALRLALYLARTLVGPWIACIRPSCPGGPDLFKPF